MTVGASDLELLLGKPGGAGLPTAWAERHADDVARVAQAGRDLGSSENWIQQVSLLAACTVCLHAAVAPRDLREQHFTDLFVELEGAAQVSASARTRAATRCFALQLACYQLGTLTRAPRRRGTTARSPAQLAAAITQPEIPGRSCAMPPR